MEHGALHTRTWVDRGALLTVALCVAGCPPMDAFANATTPRPAASATSTQAGPAAHASPSRALRGFSAGAQAPHAAPQPATRHVLVNNEALNAEQLQQVDALNCGAPVPDGSYWLDLQQRRWGYTTDRESREFPDCGNGSEQAAEATPAPSEAPVAATATDDEAAFQRCAAQYRYQEDIDCYCRNVCVTWPSATDPGSATITY